MPDESEMMADLAAADAAGDAQLAQHIAGAIKAARAPKEPGIFSKALTALSTPFKGMEPLVAQRKAASTGGVVGKDSPDWLAGAGAFVSGIPGFQHDSTSPQFDERMTRFRTEHPWAAALLPLAGGLGKPGMLPVEKGATAVQEGGNMLSRALENAAIKAGRRTLYGGANGLSEKFPVPDSSMRAAIKAGAFKPLGTTEHAANVLSDALDELGSIKGEVVKEMEAAGIRGPDTEAISQFLRSKAGWFRKNSAGTRIPDLYEKVAADIEQIGPGRMRVQQAENVKRSLQDSARYGDPNEKMLNLERRRIASTVRQGVEDASAADAATIGTPQLQDARSKLQDLRDFHNMGPSDAGSRLPGDLVSAVTPAETAAQDARAAALSSAAQAANEKLVPAKQAFALLDPAAKAAEKGLSQATKRNAFSLRDTLMAAPMAAAHGAGAGAGMAVLTKALRTYGPSTAAWAAQFASEMAGKMSPKAIAEALIARGVPQTVAEQLTSGGP